MFERDIGNGESGLEEVLHHVKMSSLRKDLRLGDRVKIINGELKGIQGVVMECKGDAITIEPTNVPGHREHMILDIYQLTLMFVPGDKVVVEEGQHRNETGIVVDADEFAVHVMTTDQPPKHLQVKTGHVRLADERINTSHHEEGRPDLKVYDLILVQTPIGHRAGVVLSVARDGIRIMYDDGDIFKTKWNQFVSKMNHIRKSSNDVNFNAIAKGDYVKIIEGQWKGMNGTIKHVYKSSAWLYVQELHSEDLGLVAIESTQKRLSKSVGSEDTVNVQLGKRISTVGNEIRVISGP